jgi:hypothetical protein
LYIGKMYVGGASGPSVKNTVPPETLLPLGLVGCVNPGPLVGNPEIDADPPPPDFDEPDEDPHPTTTHASTTANAAAENL